MPLPARGGHRGRARATLRRHAHAALTVKDACDSSRSRPTASATSPRIPFSSGPGFTLVAGENGAGQDEPAGGARPSPAASARFGGRARRRARRTASRSASRREVRARRPARSGSASSGRARQGRRVLARREGDHVPRSLGARARGLPRPRAPGARDGSPDARRRFLDRLVLGWRPAAGDDLVALRARARRAKRPARRTRTGARPDDGELETWTEELVPAGAAVRRAPRGSAGRVAGRFFAPLARDAGAAFADIQAEYPAGGETAEDAARGVRADAPGRAAPRPLALRPAPGRPALHARRPAARVRGLDGRDPARRGAREARRVAGGLARAARRRSPVRRRRFRRGSLPGRPSTRSWRACRPRTQTIPDERFRSRALQGAGRR